MSVPYDPIKRLEIRGIDRGVWRQVKAQAALKGIPVGQLVTAWLRERLEAEKGEERDSGNH